MKKILSLLTLLLCVCSGAWAEDTYYLVDRTNGPALNTTDFRTGGTVATKYGEKTFDGLGTVSGHITLGGINSNTSGIYQQNKYIAYDVKTTATAFKICVYNGNSSAKNLLYSEIKEGETSEPSDRKQTKSVSGKTQEIYEFSTTNTKNSTVYFYVSGTDVVFYQIEVIESGTTLPVGGERGYSVNLNKGRLSAPSGTAALLDGIEYCTSSNYGVINKGAVEITTKGTHYVKFTTTQTTKATVTVSSSSTYYLATAKNPESADIVATYTATSNTNLPAGTYYIVPNGSKVSVTGLAFALPDAPGAIAFDPAAGEIAANQEITLSSTNSEVIKYQWSSAAIDGEGDWSGAETYAEDNKPSTPSAGSSNTVLSVWASNDGGNTYGSAAYTIVANVAPSKPAITGDPGEAVAVGAEVTLTAASATGLPTPSYKWYQCDNAEKENPVEKAATAEFSPSTNVAGTFYYYVVATNVEGSAISDVVTLVVKNKLGLPVTNGQVYYMDSQSVTFAAPDGAPVGTKVYYSQGSSSNPDPSVDGTEYTEPIAVSVDRTLKAIAVYDGYISSDVLTLSMYKVGDVDAGQETITEATTWSFVTDGNCKVASTITNSTVPAAANPELLSSVTAYSKVAVADYISFVRPQHYHQSGYCQAHGFIIKTSVPGKLYVKYTNGNDNKRYLVVNGEKISYIANSKSHIESDNIAIPTGTTLVYGLDDASGVGNNLRFEIITFTPVTSVSGTITASNWNTFSSNYPLDLSTISGGTAYVAKSAADGKVVMTECTNKVAAGTGLMIKGTANAEFSINTTADATTAPEANLLVGLPNGGEAPVGSYVFGWPSEDATAYGFYYVDSAAAALGAGKAYLDAGGSVGARLSFIFDDEETTGITDNKRDTITNNGEYFNLAGQKVAQPTKGLYIVNGRKVVVR